MYNWKNFQFFLITISDDNSIKIWYNTKKVKITKVTYKSKRKKVKEKK